MSLLANRIETEGALRIAAFIKMNGPLTRLDIRSSFFSLNMVFMHNNTLRIDNPIDGEGMKALLNAIHRNNALVEIRLPGTSFMIYMNEDFANSKSLDDEASAKGISNSSVWCSCSSFHDLINP